MHFMILTLSNIIHLLIRLKSSVSAYFHNVVKIKPAVSPVLQANAKMTNILLVLHIIPPLLSLSVRSEHSLLNSIFFLSSPYHTGTSAALQRCPVHSWTSAGTSHFSFVFHISSERAEDRPTA